MKAEVALITPIFNTESYLHRCIKSVLEQENISLQYFLIDDGSSDRSAEIAKYYQRRDSRITFIQKNNEGQGTARNIGIKLADADYIYFIDSDDFIGKDCLSTLYRTAKDNALDICSPGVPSHYFEKPLEFISCLPCKSQFIRLDIIREFNILQPLVRSGQDGVFSNMVLSHCQRIGMVNSATYNYTHNRDNSTFATYLKKHDVVAQLLEQHFEAIIKHYDHYNLWSKNALRVLEFISVESLCNRINPHFNFLNDEHKCQCFAILKKVIEKAVKYVANEDFGMINPIVLEIANSPINTLVKTYDKLMDKKYQIKYTKNENIYKKDIVICKIGDKRFLPSRNTNKESILSENVSNHIAQYENKIDVIPKNDFKHLNSKIDFILNSINNSLVQIKSALHFGAANLNDGEPNLVVSLTTLPNRINLVHYAIESIFSQTLLPSKMILWISDKIDDKDISRELLSLVSRGLEIKKVKDVGSHTKLIYALKEYPKQSIITVDDDVIYPINTIQYLWEQHIKYPKAIVANWARELTFYNNGRVKGVRSGKLLTPIMLEHEIEQAKSHVSVPNILAFPYGTLGVLYPPKSLNEKVHDTYLFQKLCPKEDDIWFRAMGILNKTPVVVTNLGINPVHHCLTGSQFVALRHENHGLSQNEQQMQAVFEYFDLYKYL